MIDHFVPRIQHRTEGDVERLRHSHRHQNLRLRIIRGAEVLRHVLADADAQRFETEVRGVARLAFFQRADHRLTDRPRGWLVGFTDAERNDIGATDDEFEEIANAGARQIANDV